MGAAWLAGGWMDRDRTGGAERYGATVLPVLRCYRSYGATVLLQPTVLPTVDVRRRCRLAGWLLLLAAGWLNQAGRRVKGE